MFIDSSEWKEELQSKSSLSIYREHKKKFGDEHLYDNRRSSELLFKARTNTLELFNRNRFRAMDGRKCPFCDEIEDIVHFLLKCPPLEPWRNRRLIESCTSPNQSEVATAGRVLFDFGGGGPEPVKQMILAMWRSRGKLFREMSGNSSRIQQ